MRILATIIISILIFASCGKSTNEGSGKDSAKVSELKPFDKNAKVQVLYFHSAQRCATCNAVEVSAKELLSTNFKQKMDDGSVSFGVFDIGDEANKDLVTKHLVSYSTLLIIKNEGGTETVEDITDVAFQYARSNPPKFAEVFNQTVTNFLLKF